MRHRMPKVELMVRRRRMLSLALGLSVTSASAMAQTELPSLPELPPLPISATAPLPQPYPFANPTETKSKAVSARVVGLLGLSVSTNQKPTAPATFPTALLKPMAGADLADLPSTESQVVMATALQATTSETVEFAGTIEFEETSDQGQPSQLPARTDERELAGVGSLSASLIDIDIPLEGSSNPTVPVPKVPTVLVTEASLPELPSSTPEQSPSRTPTIYRPESAQGLSLHKLQPKSEVTPTKPESRSSRGDVELASRVTEASAVVQGSEVYSLSDDAVSSFSLSDKETISKSNNTIAVHRDRDFSLRQGASNGMQIPTMSHEPRAMQVQIEGVSNSPTQLTSTGNHKQPGREPLEILFNEDAPRRNLTNPAPATNGGSRLGNLTSKQRPPASSSGSIAPGQMKHGSMLRVGIQDAMLVQSDVPIIELSVENPEVCQLLQTGSQSYSLLGLHAGSTRIALVSSLDNGERTVEIREVSVAPPGVPNNSGLEGLAEGISASLEKLYPQYAIDIDIVDRSLLVQGEVSSELEAKRIIAFVRKASLSPVVDRLKSQEQ